MGATIPRAEVEDIARRYDSGYCFEGDPTSEWVRALASSIRPDWPAEADPRVAEADDLDALADRYEQGNA